MGLSIAGTTELLEHLVEQRELLVGCEGYVAHDGGETSFALGIGAPGKECDGGTIWRLACGGKPLVAIGVACLVEDGMLDLEDAVSSIIPEFRGGNKEAITVENVLSHTANLDPYHRGNPEFAKLSREARHEKVCSLVIRQGRLPGERSDYSDYAAWHLLGCIIEQLSEQPFGDFLRERLFQPLGMADTFFSMTTGEYEQAASRIGVFYDLRGHSPAPMLFDRTQLSCSLWDPAQGCYATAADLGRFYLGLLRIQQGNAGILSQDVLQRFVGRGRGVMWDHTFRRNCEFGLGFMRNLSLFEAGSWCSRESYGHLAFGGMIVGFCDPVHDLVVSLVVNGLLDWSAQATPRSESAVRRRIRIVDAIYEDVLGPDLLRRQPSR